MGKNNRQRRAAKARRKTARGRRPPPPALPFPPRTSAPQPSATAGPTVDELLDRIGGPIAFLHVADGSLVASLAQLDADAVRSALGRRLLAAVAAAWERG